MRARLAVLTSSLALLTSCCFPFSTSGPRTWQDRYNQATTELSTAKTDVERTYALTDAAKAAFEIGKPEEAKQHALMLLDLAKEPRDWNYGNAVHDGHMVLGRIALKAGDLETAKRELLLAGQTPGSPQLDSFGPNMSLAKDLLEQKQTDAVVEYFTLCAKFWKMGQTQLKHWTILAKAGEIPDFGANLVY